MNAHPLFFIPELITIICTHVDKNSDLLRLACTSSIFLEPALNALWAEVTQLGTLIRCFPKSLLSKNDTYTWGQWVVTFKRALEPEDWTRFHFYAKRIRSLKIHYPMPVDTTALEDLTLGSAGNCLCPNLRSLFWHYDITDLSLSTLYLFLGPRLTKLDLIFFSSGPRSRFPTFLNHLPIRCPAIKDIWIDTPEDNSEICKSASAALCRWHTLRKVHIELSLTYEAILHLAGLATLEVLYWMAVDGDILNEIRGGEPIFPKLRDLLLEGSADSCEMFLRMLQGGSLVEADIVLLQDQSSCFSPIRRNIHSHLERHPHIRRLKIVDRYEESIRWPGDPLALRLEDIEPLFMLRDLEKLKLYPAVIFDFDDEDVRKMGDAWSHIEKLCLCHYNVSHPGFEARPTPRTTMAGLVQLFERCPNLSKLGLAFDASIMPNILPDYVNDKVKVLYVQDCPIPSSSIEDVAAFLFKHFPKSDVVYPPGRIGERSDWWEHLRCYVSVLRSSRDEIEEDDEVEENEHADDDDSDED